VELTKGFTRFSAMLDPRTLGTDGNAALESVPLNATLAFNPNTNQLIIVPTQGTESGTYVMVLGNMQSTKGASDPLLDSAGKAAGTAGPPVFASFGLEVAASAVMAAGRGASPAVVTATTVGAVSRSMPEAASPGRSTVVLRPTFSTLGRRVLVPQSTRQTGP
jgi:hypothetical protein